MKRPGRRSRRGRLQAPACPRPCPPARGAWPPGAYGRDPSGQPPEVLALVRCPEETPLPLRPLQPAETRGPCGSAMDEGPSGPRGPAGERPHTLKRTACPTQTPVKHALWAREADGDLPNHGDARAVGPRASLLLASEGRLRRGAGRAHPELAPERREGRPRQRGSASGARPRSWRAGPRTWFTPSRLYM